MTSITAATNLCTRHLNKLYMYATYIKLEQMHSKTNCSRPAKTVTIPKEQQCTSSAVHCLQTSLQDTATCSRSYTALCIETLADVTVVVPCRPDAGRRAGQDAAGAQQGARESADRLPARLRRADAGDHGQSVATCTSFRRVQYTPDICRDYVCARHAVSAPDEAGGSPTSRQRFAHAHL